MRAKLEDAAQSLPLNVCNHDTHAPERRSGQSGQESAPICLPWPPLVPSFLWHHLRATLEAQFWSEIMRVLIDWLEEALN